MDLTAAHDLVVAMDYGQFLLRGGPSAYLSDDQALLEVAQGEGVASDGNTVLVLSPHQNNFDMPLRVEVWGGAPADDLDAWEEVFEATLEVESDGALRYDSPTLTGVECAVAPGRYRVRVAGRGIIASGWPGSTTPGDSWRACPVPANVSESAPSSVKRPPTATTTRSP